MSTRLAISDFAVGLPLYAAMMATPLLASSPMEDAVESCALKFGFEHRVEALQERGWTLIKDTATAKIAAEHLSLIGILEELSQVGFLSPPQGKLDETISRRTQIATLQRPGFRSALIEINTNGTASRVLLYEASINEEVRIIQCDFVGATEQNREYIDEFLTGVEPGFRNWFLVSYDIIEQPGSITDYPRSSGNLYILKRRPRVELPFAATASDLAISLTTLMD